ncbi:transposon Tf2-6 polyprotein [Trichonephila clavipes]|nr:transposon Tf2-6 polyprotein [Trichonephila clavipes]
MLKNGVRHKTSAPFKPSSNGQAERYVATLKQSLRAMHKYEEQLIKWQFGTIVNQDGVLHYIIDDQGTLVRRHVDQIRPVGDKVQENIIVMHQIFHHQVQENNSNIQHAETAEDISKDRNKNWVHLPYKECHQLMLRFQIYHSLQLKRLTRDEESTSSRHAIS